MATERLPIDAALGAYLDGLADPPGPLADLYREHGDHPQARMMTHPDLGRLLSVLVRATGGRAVLEVGTFVGVSATWIALALDATGHLDTLELDPDRADAAQAWFLRAGIADRVTVHRGPALDTLARLPDGAYDLAYIDADKPGYAAYLDHAARLVRRGGLILADNVLWDGLLGGRPQDDDADTAALRSYTRAAIDHPRLETTVLTVGDGVALSVVR